MKKIFFISLICISMGYLFAQELIPWHNLRHSSMDQNSQVHLRWENIDPLVPAPELYMRLGNSAWQQQNINSLPQAGSYEALVNYNWSQKLRYRLRSELAYEGVNMAFMHAAYLDADTFPPNTENMGLIGPDPASDTIQIDEPALDLGDSWMAASQDKLYNTVANQSGQFPTMVSFTSYNVYLTAIANPEAIADSVVYAMVYTANIPGVVSPGLYKVGIEEGLTPTFARIGNIQSSVSGGKLYMACNISDLTSDPNFGAWPNSFNALAFSSFTMRLNIDLATMTPEILIGDYSFPGMVFFDDYLYEVAQNTIPEVSGFEVEGGLVSCYYQDAEGDFPLTCEFVTDQGSVLQLNGDSHDYLGGVYFSALLPANPRSGTLRVSDNDIYYQEFEWEEVPASDPVLVPGPLECSFANPVRMGAPIAISLKGLKPGRLMVSLYNLRGQKVLSLELDAGNNPEKEVVLNPSPGANGIYLLKATQAGRSIMRKISIIR